MKRSKVERAREIVAAALAKGPCDTGRLGVLAAKVGLTISDMSHAAHSMGVLFERSVGRHSVWRIPPGGLRTVQRAGAALRRATGGGNPKPVAFRDVPHSERFAVLDRAGRELAEAPGVEGALYRGRMLIDHGAVAVIGVPHATPMALLGNPTPPPNVVARAVERWLARQQQRSPAASSPSNSSAAGSRARARTTAAGGLPHRGSPCPA